jgi:microcystin-dependent protein
MLLSGLLVTAAPAEETGLTGGGQPVEVMQPSLAMMYLIRVAGDPEGLGEIVPFAGSFVPGGWAAADGQLLNIAEHEALYAVLGTTFGGDGTTTFALPDLRGRAVIGTGQATGLTNRALGEPLGAETITLTEEEMAAHDHTLPGGGTTVDAGGSAPFPNMQPSLALSYLMPLPAPRPGAPVAQTPFLGQVRVFARLSPPADHVPASGQTLPVADNPDLFALIGSTYGGDGVDSVALPDLRGRVAMGSGQGPGLTGHALGESLGSEAVALTVEQLPSHDHTLPSPSDPTGTTGGGQPVGIMQPSLALTYILATDGTFPWPGGDTDTGPGTVLGQLALFAGDVPPSGWAFADGSLIPISLNTALFSLLGTTFGGDGKSSFAFPDLRGRVIIGAGQGATLSNRSNGEEVGAESSTLTVDQLPPHLHEFGPEATVSEASDLVQDLQDQGVLNQGQAAALLAKLAQALASLEQGNTAAACGQLKAFSKQVDAYVSAGILTAAEGEALKDLAGEVMSNIGC